MRAFHLKKLLVSLAFLTSCAKDVPSPSCDGCRESTATKSVDSEKRGRQLSGEIANMLANKSCTSDDDCKLIGIGHTPCGHPAAFYTYSSLNVDVALLEEKARELRDIQQQSTPNDVSGVCGFTSPPPPACSKENTVEEKRCILPGYNP